MSRSEKLAASLDRLRKAHNHIKYDEDGDWHLQLPGLKSGDFNRAGLPCIAKISRMTEMMRARQISTANDSKIDENNQNVVLMVKCRLLTITPQFYELAAINFPMTVRGGISKIGRTSFDLTQAAYADDHNSEEPVMRCMVRFVAVNLLTGKAVPVTDDLVQRLSSRTFPAIESLTTPNQPINAPSDAFKWSIRVRHEDIDLKSHANQASYLTFATECAAEAARANYYSRVVEDVAFYPVKRAYGVYMGEAVVGDDLDVSTWEDADDKMRLHFTINKRNRMLFYAQLDLFDCVLVTSRL